MKHKQNTNTGKTQSNISQVHSPTE